MDRREILTNLGLITAAVPAISLFTGEAFAASAAVSPQDALIASASKCIETGLKCEKLCIETLSQGDKSMVECMTAIQQMLTMVRATAELAAQKSPMLTKMAGLCAAACEDCQKQCDKHAKHHDICAACSKACQDCIKACKAV